MVKNIQIRQTVYILEIFVFIIELKTLWSNETNVIDPSLILVNSNFLFVYVSNFIFIFTCQFMFKYAMINM